MDNLAIRLHSVNTANANYLHCLNCAGNFARGEATQSAPPNWFSRRMRRGLPRRQQGRPEVGAEGRTAGGAECTHPCPPLNCCDKRPGNYSKNSTGFLRRQGRNVTSEWPEFHRRTHRNRARKWPENTGKPAPTAPFYMSNQRTPFIAYGGDAMGAAAAILGD